MAANSEEKARALEQRQRERDLELAIERMVNLRLDDAHGGTGAAPEDGVHPAAAATAAKEEEEMQMQPAVGVDVLPESDGGVDRTEWIDALMSAMASARSVEDARALAARFLEDFEASVTTACRGERDAALLRNGLLKRAFLLEFRLRKETEAANRELENQLARCQQRIRSLERDNYALAMYLRQAQPQGGSGSITGPFHPGVF